MRGRTPSTRILISQPSPNGAIVKLGSDGAIDVRASAPTEIIVDVNGWFRPATSATAGRYVPITAQRAFDSRSVAFARPLQPRETITVARSGTTITAAGQSFNAASIVRLVIGGAADNRN